MVGYSMPHYWVTLCPTGGLLYALPRWVTEWPVVGYRVTHGGLQSGPSTDPLRWVTEWPVVGYSMPHLSGIKYLEKEEKK